MLARSALCGPEHCAADSTVGMQCPAPWAALAPTIGASCSLTGESGAGGDASEISAEAGSGAAASAAGTTSDTTKTEVHGGGCSFGARAASTPWFFGVMALFALARRRYRALLSLAALTGSVSGCGQHEPEYENYDGPPAFPNRRTSYRTSSGSFGLVSDSLSDTLSLVDLDAMERVAAIPVGRDPVDIDGPHHLAVDRARGLVYVALSYPPPSAIGPHASHGYSQLAGYVQVLLLADFSTLAELRVEQNPGDVALSAAGELAVSHFDLLRAQQISTLDAQRAALILVDPAAGLLDGTDQVQRISLCITPHAIAFDPARPRAYVSCTGEDAVAIVDLSNASVIDRVPVADAIGTPGSPEHEPYALELAPSGTQLLVSNTASHTVALFSVGDALERQVTAALLGAPYFGAWLDEHEALVPTQGPSGVARIDLSTGELELDTTFSDDECSNPHEISLLADGRTFLVCEGDHQNPGAIAEIDPNSLELLGRVEVGVYPDRMVVLE